MGSNNRMWCGHTDDDGPETCYCHSDCSCKENSCKNRLDGAMIYSCASTCKFVKCQNADKYLGLKDPYCNNGNPCKTCLEKRLEVKNKEKTKKSIFCDHDKMTSRSSIVDELKALRKKRLVNDYEEGAEIDTAIAALEWVLKKTSKPVSKDY